MKDTIQKIYEDARAALYKGDEGELPQYFTDDAQIMLPGLRQPLSVLQACRTLQRWAGGKFRDFGQHTHDTDTSPAREGILRVSHEMTLMPIAGSKAIVQLARNEDGTLVVTFTDEVTASRDGEKIKRWEIRCDQPGLFDDLPEQMSSSDPSTRGTSTTPRQ
jgi:hypothetical protein